MSITLGEIRTQARQRSDMEHSLYVSDSEANSYINASLKELHDLLIKAYNEEYVMEVVTFASVAGQIAYDLPDGVNYSGAPKFYKLRGVDVSVGTQGNAAYAVVKRFNFNRRNEDINNVAWSLLGIPFLEYRLVGATLRFNRTPDANTNFRAWYYPVCQQLVNDSDAYDDINGWAEYVVVDVAIKMLQKEESDVSVLMAQKEALKKRIEGMAENRDANEPESVSDVYNEDNNYYWLRR